MKPSNYQVDQGARQIVTWETGWETWPDSWHPLEVYNARITAYRVWNAMNRARHHTWPNPLQLELFNKDEYLA